MDASISKFPPVKFKRLNVKPAQQGLGEYCVGCPRVDQHIVQWGKVSAGRVAYANVDVHNSHIELAMFNDCLDSAGRNHPADSFLLFPMYQ